MLIIFCLSFMFILVFGLMIHECGHFIAMRLVYLPVEEVRIGIGPRILQKGYFHLHLIPVSAYIQCKEKAVKQLSASKRVLIDLAGIMMNLFVAFVVLLVLHQWIDVSINLIFHPIILFNESATYLYEAKNMIEFCLILFSIEWVTLNIFIAIVNLMPLPTTDGWEFLCDLKIVLSTLCSKVIHTVFEK